MAENKLVFVVGLWRSGTSLLHAMLNLHPRIALMFESEPLILWPPHTSAAQWPSDWPEKLDFFNQAISRHKLETAQLPRRVTGREGVLALFQTYARQKGATVMGGKAPAYHAMLPEIHRIFPEASFIILWRHPADCCRSAVAAGQSDGFFAQRGLPTRILFGADALAGGVERLRAEGGRVHEVVYDELVNEPEAGLRAICQFLEIPHDPAMTKLATADLSVLPAGRHHDSVRSGGIQTRAPRTPGGPPAETLSPAFLAKARRYAALWSERYRHLGLARALSQDAGRPLPGRGERWLDATRYLFWCQLDRLKHRVLGNLPLAWWRRCRRTAVPAPEICEPNPKSSRAHFEF